MNKFFSHKLFEIFFEKALIALVLILAGYLANQSLERYKLIEVQRLAGTSAFVNACQEIWQKLYEYEATVNSEADMHKKLFISKIVGGKKYKDYEVEIERKVRLGKQQLTDLEKVINDRKFIIGQKLAIHFWEYFGLVRERANAEITTFEKVGIQAKASEEAIEIFDRKIASLRFSADMAREYSISQLPR